MDLQIVLRIAERQFGLVTRDQLSRSGISDRQTTRLVRNGTLVRVHRAVYRFPGSDASIQQQGLAACLAVGRHAVASHSMAGALWGIVEVTQRISEVTIPWGHRSRQTAIVIHRSQFLDRGDVTRIGPVPVTRAARTLADLATQLSDDDLEEAVDQAMRRRLVTPDQLDRYARLRPLAEDLRSGTPGSQLERKAIKALRAAGLPEPVRQHNVRTRGRTYRIDLAYPERMVAIELEGEAPHWGRARRQYDFDRRNALELLGWRVFPYTWADTTERSLYFVTRVGEALGLRPTRWTSAAR